MEAEEVFRELIQSSAFTGTVSIDKKRGIFLSVWKEKVRQLKQQYNKKGIWDGDGENGFGFLVEAFAKKSLRVPTNSEAGDRLSRLLIHALHTGDEAIGIGRRLHNPDFIWIKNKGGKSIITGIGEIKSSAEAFNKSISQIQSFEGDLRHLLGKIKQDKQAGKAIQQIAFKKIDIAFPLEKILVMPAGQRARIKRLPDGWKLVEIEFSYRELILIARHIWPKFCKDFNPGNGYLAGYNELVEKIIEWGEPRLSQIFFGSSLKPFPTLEYLLYTFAVRKLPLTDRQVRLVMACVNEADFMPSFPPKLANMSSLSIWEKEFLECFSIIYGHGDSKSTNYLLHFIHDYRSFAARLKKIIKRRCLAEELDEKAPVKNLLKT